MKKLFQKQHQLTRMLLLFLLFSGACGDDNKKRTAIRTTDFEIPDPPTQQERGAAPAQNALPEDQRLLKACMEGSSAELSVLLESDLNPDLSDQDGRTGMMWACYYGHLQVVRQLLDSGADVHLKDSLGRTALMYAATGHYPSTVELLLNQGADPNIQDQSEGFTALMFAGAEGNMEVVRLLLEHNANPALTDKDGDTAESFARQNGHAEVADLLNKL